MCSTTQNRHCMFASTGGQVFEGRLHLFHRYRTDVYLKAEMEFKKNIEKKKRLKKELQFVDGRPRPPPLLALAMSSTYCL